MSGIALQRNKVVALVAILALTVGAGSAMAGRTVNWVEVDGAAATTVTPGATISVSVNVTLTFWSSWDSTRYKIGDGSWQCVNTQNHSAWNQAFTESFNITAPMDLGSHDLSIRAYENNGCNGDNASYTLADAITVVECLEAANCDDDGDPCTDAACEANVCVHNPKDCGDGFCKPDTGECVECLEDADCDSGFCVDNACVECIEDANCDDDDLCTTDACVDHACVNEPVDCGDGVCDPENCECVECLVNDDCPRHKICTQEYECIWYWDTGGGPAPIIPGGGDDDDDDEAVECVEDADCEDGDLCTINICADDACVTLPVECAEDEICDPDTGECFTDPDSGQPIPEPGDDDDDDADDDDDDDDAPAGKCGLLGFGQMGMMLTGLTLMRVSRRRRHR